MKNKKILICYEEVRKLFNDEYKKTEQLISGGETHLDNLAEGFLEADRVISKLPTVDAVQVVRCNDCQQWRRNCGIADSPNGHCFYHDIDMNGFDFCSYGERKNNV